jgi:prepilin-type N-terminal cleavage/methylation domain-containing protein
MTNTSTNIRRVSGSAGYTLVELLVSMGIMSLVMAATMTTVSNAVKANDTVLQMSGMNNSLRVAMDIITRDLLQVGSGLPKSHLISVPSGGPATPFRIPGPPGSTFTSVAGDPDINAVIPGPGLGPVINGQATDTITILTADTALVSVPLTAMSTGTQSITLAANNQSGQPVNITAGADKVVPGQLIWLDKGGVNTLLQVRTVNTTTRVLGFAVGDSLNLNQTAAGITAGNLNAVAAAAPTGAAGAAATLATRVRMISYYLDTTIANHPRLVRRINNGHPTSFDNTLGTAVATDVEGLSFTYDLADGPTMVRFTQPDLSGGTGDSCGGPCSVNMIRKINVSLTGRSANAAATKSKAYRNTLTSQISLRGMSFFNQFQ